MQEVCNQNYANLQWKQNASASLPILQLLRWEQMEDSISTQTMTYKLEIQLGKNYFMKDRDQSG